MTIKKFIALALLLFAGTFLFLTVLSIHRTQPPPFGKLSENLYAFPESPKRSLLGLDIPLLNDLLPYLPFVHTSTPYLQNVCLNGSDPSSMGTQEQLLQFIQGPCLPVVIVPGLSASKLQVNIDCETLQSENPDIFSACGWGTCNSWNVLESMPDSSYTIWIPDLISPVSLTLESTVNCWANLIQQQVNSSDPDLLTKYTSPAGVQIVVQSDSDSDDSEACGFSAQDNLLPSPIQANSSVGFEYMKNALVAMGYQVGLTLYGAPYDWRKTTVANGIGTILNNTVQQIYSLTGKPTVIVAHSLGNFGTLYLLNSLSTEDKQKYIANYVSLMNPLSGSPKSLLGYLGADTQYYLGHDFGVNYAAWKIFLNANTGSMDVVTKDPFNYFAGEQWLQEWQSRVDLENEFNASTPEGQAAWQAVANSGNYTYQWFPTPLTQCFEGFLDRPDQCGFFMYDWSTEPVVTVQDESFNASATGIADLFAAYVETTDIAPELIADVATNGVYKLQNPEVPVTIVYASHLLTTKAFTWDYDPTTVTNTGQYAVPNATSYSQGDETVPTTSSLLTALKWSWEFDNKELAGIPNAQPIKTVEVCSIYNTRGTIYDVANASAPYSVTNNEYIGVGCDCQPKPGDFTVGANCDHSSLPADSVLIQFVQNIVNANYMNTDHTKTGAYFLNDTALNQIVNNCPSVNSGPSVYWSLLGDFSEQVIYS